MIEREQKKRPSSGELTVVVAMHKPYTTPEDPVYLPMQAGAALHDSIGCARDDTDENISGKNAQYCELTALYWAWKNHPSEALGLAHYRRYLAPCHGARRAATGEELKALLKKQPILLPCKRHYWIETNQSQFEHAHGTRGLQALRKVLESRYPAYVPAFEKTLRQTRGHRFNIFVMRRDLSDAYCEWLFDVLFSAERELEKQGALTPRMMGFLSERLLDCWLLTNQYRYLELPVYNTESQHWPSKIWHFLLRKYRRDVKN